MDQTILGDKYGGSMNRTWFFVTSYRTHYWKQESDVDSVESS